MNIQCITNLPDDIYYHIMDKMESNNDILNFGKSNKIFTNIINNNITKIKVQLFRVNIKLFFDADLNKHCELCKKFKNLKNYFDKNFFKYYIDRKTNNTIFDTTTIIYFNIFIDNLKKFNLSFFRFFKENNLCKILSIDNIVYNLYIYIDNDFIIKINNDLRFNKKDILIDNNTNIKLNILSLKSFGLNIENLNFNNILENINKITYEINKNIYNENLKLKNILVFDKELIFKFLEKNDIKI